MRVRSAPLLLLATVLAAATLIAPTTALAAKSTSNKPAFSTFSWGGKSCETGTTCTWSSSTDSTGLLNTASSLNRPTVGTKTEYAYGGASAYRSVTIDRGVKELKLATTVDVGSAKAQAASTSAEGAAFGFVLTMPWLGGCAGCEQSQADFLVLAYGTAFTSDTKEATGVRTIETTVRMKDGSDLPAGRHSLYNYTWSQSYVECVYNQIVVTSLDEDNPTVLVDGCAPEVSGHSGQSSASAQIKVLSITATPV